VSSTPFPSGNAEVVGPDHMPIVTVITT